MYINAITDTHRRRLELSVGVLVVRDFVDGDDGVDREFTVRPTTFPRLQRLPNLTIYDRLGALQGTSGTRAGPLLALWPNLRTVVCFWMPRTDILKSSACVEGNIASPQAYSRQEINLVEGSGRARIGKFKSADCAEGFVSFLGRVLDSGPRLILGILYSSAITTEDYR